MSSSRARTAGRTRTRAGSAAGTASVALIAGVVTGLAAKWADGSGPSWLGDLGTGLSFWIFVTAWIGWLAPSPVWAAVRAAVYFVGLNLGYYAYTLQVLGYPVDRVTVVGWTVLAVTACPALAALVRFARRQTLGGAVVLGVAASGVLATGRVSALWTDLGEIPEGFPDRRAEALVALLMASTLVLAPRRIRFVLVALVTTVVAHRPVGLLIDTVFGRLPML